MRARFTDHHTAGYVFHRDDAEGHLAMGIFDDDRVWWFHEQRRWMSWSDLLAFVTTQPEDIILEPLFAPPSLPGCYPDGAHDGRCRHPEIFQL